MSVAKLSELCIDGTKIQANASRFRPTSERCRKEKLLQGLDAEITQAMANMESADTMDELFDDGQPADKLPSELSELKQRPSQASRSTRETSANEEQRRRDGIDNKKSPAQLPISDPDSRILPNNEGGYGAQLYTDGRY